MHKYLSAIGFSKLNKITDIQEIIQEVIDSYDEKQVVEDENGHVLCNMTKYYGEDTGIKVCGEYDENNKFYMDYYFPFHTSYNISAQAEIIFEQHSGKNSYAAAYEDPRIGITMIFFLENVIEYLNLSMQNQLGKIPMSIQLSGLAEKGSILLPIKKNEVMEQKSKENTINRSRLISAARNGDEEAMENLTMEDIDTYSMISKRIANEDVFTIVETYFMPYGLECDQYHVMGDIVTVDYMTNKKSGEKVCQMEIVCNDIHINLCVNSNQIYGEPEVGRRFRGVIWLQGHVNF